MIIFDEKKYSEGILRNKNYNTKKNQGRERSALVRYLFSINKDIDEIKNILHSIPLFNGEYLSYNELDMIYDKIILKANDFPFIQDIVVKISKSELDTILKYSDINARNLLFVYLVYYKWALNVSHLKFYSKKNDVDMVVENDNDLWKLANLSKLRVRERYMICNQFVKDRVYIQDNFKSNNYFYLPFCNNEEAVITIDNFDNIIGELLLYLDNSKYIHCRRCDVVVEKTSNNRKYCVDCAREINIEKTVKNRKV